MNKAGKGVSSGLLALIFIGVALLALTGYAVFKLTGEQPATVVQQAALTQTGQTVQTTAVVSCPSDGTTDGQVRYQDMLASTVTYDDPVVYFIPKTAGMERVTAGTLQTDGTYSTAVNLKCTEAGTRWQAIAVTKQDDAASAVGEEFVAEGSMTKVNLQSKNIGTLQMKVEDKVTGGAKFFNETVIAGAEGAYTAFNGSTAIFANGGSTGTSLTLGTDEYIDAKIYLKAATTKTQFGEDGLRTFMLVDADGSNWDEPIVAKDNGAKLVNVIDSISSDDRRHFSGYEYAYEIGVIDDREHTIDFYMQSASGVNPSADPTIELCAEGRYNSVKSTDTIKVGCYTDAASQAVVFTASEPIFQFNIA